MKFKVKNRYSGDVQFTADIDYDGEDEAIALGLAVKWAIKNNADLRDTDLSGANLRDAYLRSVDLRGANLRGVNLRGAFLIDADLRWVDLSCADMTNAILSSEKSLEDMKRLAEANDAKN